MTRFARAKGSKASNEKLFEPATSWSEMKQDLLNKTKEVETNKQREVFAKKREENYQNFLEERQNELDAKVSWADFPETSENGQGKRSNSSIKSKSPKKPKISNKSVSDGSDSELDVKFEALKSKIDKVLVKPTGSEEANIEEQPKEIILKKAKKPKQKLKIFLDKEGDNKPATKMKPTENNVVVDLSEKDQAFLERQKERRRRTNEKKKLRKVQAKELGKNEVIEPKSEIVSEVDKKKLEKKLERRKRQKEKLKVRKENLRSSEPKSEEDLKKIQKRKEKLAKQAEKRRALKAANVSQPQNTNNYENNTSIETEQINTFPNKNAKTAKPAENKALNVNQPKNNSNNNNENGPINKFLNKRPFDGQNAKKAKPRDNKEHSSRKQKPEKMFINGKTVEVDYIDGFPVKKEDADRLKKLRKEMISKGLPRSEINASLKLERRRAEKALTREKKNVCFNCRKSGHNLSECPELDKDQTVQSSGTGICFKCGSTEHTHFECKVVKGLDYKFATCFVCKEQGHIAKQCPDNQRGLYPKGGSCKVCGDVTHLKRDCRKYQAQQAQLQNAFSVGTIDNANPDDLDGKGKHVQFSNNGPKRMNKVVKF